MINGANISESSSGVYDFMWTSLSNGISDVTKDGTGDSPGPVTFTINARLSSAEQTGFIVPSSDYAGETKCWGEFDDSAALSSIVTLSDVSNQANWYPESSSGLEEEDIGNRRTHSGAISCLPAMLALILISY